MKQVAVIGLGQFGMHLARTLVKMGCEVLALDVNEQRVEDVRDDVHRALIGDARDHEMLGGILGPEINEAVVCLGENTIEPSILCTLNLKRIGVQLIRSTAKTTTTRTFSAPSAPTRSFSRSARPPSAPRGAWRTPSCATCSRSPRTIGSWTSSRRARRMVSRWWT